MSLTEMPVLKKIFRRKKYRPNNSTDSATPKVSDSLKKEPDSLKKEPDPLKTMDSSFSRAIIPCLHRPECDTTFEAISGLESAKKELKLTAVWPFVNPDLFTDFTEPARGVLLFGPPNSGKTLLAQALVNESKESRSFITINASTLTSENYSEREYRFGLPRYNLLTKWLFEVARYNKPSILFIDQIDRLLSECIDGKSDDIGLLWTEFFKNLRSDQSDGVLTLATTNKPHLLDEATLSRFPKRIYIGLPDCDARKDLIIKLLDQQSNSLTAGEIEKLAELTDGYSVPDIIKLAKDAAFAPVYDLCDGQSSESIEKFSSKDARPISFSDFRESLEKIGPTCEVSSIEKLTEWGRKYGVIQ